MSVTPTPLNIAHGVERRYLDGTWFGAFISLLAVEYYCVLFPALCYGFHGLDLEDLRALWGAGAS